jgi:hypothetical protein
MQPNDPLAEYGPEDVKPVVDLKDEQACREWMAAMWIHETHYAIMPRITEVDDVLTGMTADMRNAWAVGEQLALSTSGGPFWMPKPSRERAAKLIARGRAVPYGEELQKRGIDADRQIIWFVNSHARPFSAEQF